MNKLQAIFAVLGTVLVLITLPMTLSIHADISSLIDKTNDLIKKTEDLSQAIQDIDNELQSTNNRISDIEVSLEQYSSRIMRLEQYSSRIMRLENLHLK